MSKYACNTFVSEEKSRAEIEQILKRYEATEFAYANMQTRAVIVFKMKERRIRFQVPMPEPEKFMTTKSGRMRTRDGVIEKSRDQAIRQRWRALSLAVKAKLEAVESGITTFEEEFMAHIVLPNGKTTGEVMLPELAICYQNKKMPPLLSHMV